MAPSNLRDAFKADFVAAEGRWLALLRHRSSRTVAEFDRRLDRHWPKPGWNAIATAIVVDICHGTFFILKVRRSASLTGEARYCLTKPPRCVKPT